MFRACRVDTAPDNFGTQIHTTHASQMTQAAQQENCIGHQQQRQHHTCARICVCLSVAIAHVFMCCIMFILYYKNPEASFVVGCVLLDTHCSAYNCTNASKLNTKIVPIIMITIKPDDAYFVRLAINWVAFDISACRFFIFLRGLCDISDFRSSYVQLGGICVLCQATRGYSVLIS